jgi:glucosamine kinase
VLIAGGQVTELAEGPPMNALLTAGLTEQLRQIITAAGPTVAGVGLPGVRMAGEARRLSRALTRQAGCPVHVTGDADAARHAAFLGAPGVVVIAGTGSAALGWDGERFARAGGHGFLLGDEGSAYWIGREAVRAALRFQERSGGSEQIYRTVTEVAGSGLDVLIAEVNAHPADRGRLAVLAPAVTAIAGHDPEARRILQDAAESLAALAESIRRRLGPRATRALPTGALPTGVPPTGAPLSGVPPTGVLPVAGVGGVFRDPALWARFAELTGATRPLAPAAVGAALLAATCTARSPAASCSLHLDPA